MPSTVSPSAPTTAASVTSTTSATLPKPPHASAVEAALSSSLRETLNLASWGDGPGLEELLGKVQAAIEQSILEEAKLRETIRSNILSELRNFPDAPASAGVYSVPDRWLRDARRNLLLPGHVTACDGVSTGHEGLTATVASIGVCLIRYDGRMNSWQSTFLRQDYHTQTLDPVAQLRAVLDRRGSTLTRDGTATAEAMHTLLRRGLMAVAERKALLERTQSRWRMGHGVPAPLELLTGAGANAIIDLALPILEPLLLGHPRWVFSPDTLANRALLTVANALAPGELAIFQTGKPMLEAIVESTDYAPGYRKRVEAFTTRLGAASVLGGFRATRYAPPQLFVAHADLALEAGLIAMADASLNPHRGSPLILELAMMGARNGLGLNAFQGIVASAYVRAQASELFHQGRVQMHDA
ncbi:MAG: hypothetical protein LC104_14450 [Bacteroidales bacterium]|nr:hypothetical protein [Bacteroidales bacterium]